MIMEHRDTGNRIDSGSPFSIGALLLGPLWFFIKGMILPGVLAGAGVILTFGLGWLALPFIYPALYRKQLERQGYVVVKSAENFSRAPGDPAPDPTEAIAAGEAMQRAIAGQPVDLTICMECGSRQGVTGRDFGFARILDKTSEFSGGKFKWSTRASIVRGEMVFCEACWKKHKNMVGLPKLTDADYALHPWWATAQKYGFTTHLDAHEVQRYQAAPRSGP